MKTSNTTQHAIKHFSHQILSLENNNNFLEIPGGIFNIYQIAR